MFRSAMLIFLLGCGAFAAHAQTDTKLVKLERVAASSSEVTRQFFGHVVAKETVDLAFQVSGQVVDIPIIEGEPVPKGAMIAQLDLEPFELALAQAVIYVATAPKSNGAYVAYKAAMRDAKSSGSLLPPKHILNAPTKLMKEEGYGAGYQYDHDAPDGFSGQDYFPAQLGRQTYYDPPERGFERDLRKRLEYWSKLRRERG